MAVVWDWAGLWTCKGRWITLAGGWWGVDSIGSPCEWCTAEHSSVPTSGGGYVIWRGIVLCRIIWGGGESLSLLLTRAKWYTLIRIPVDSDQEFISMGTNKIFYAAWRERTLCGGIHTSKGNALHTPWCCNGASGIRNQHQSLALVWFELRDVSPCTDGP